MGEQNFHRNSMAKTRMAATLRIAFTFDIGTFAAIKALLTSEDIAVLDIAVGGHISIAGADQGYYVEVLPEDQDRARQILSECGMDNYLLDSDR